MRQNFLEVARMEVAKTRSLTLIKAQALSSTDTYRGVQPGIKKGSKSTREK